MESRLKSKGQWKNGFVVLGKWKTEDLLAISKDLAKVRGNRNDHRTDELGGRSDLAYHHSIMKKS